MFVQVLVLTKNSCRISHLPLVLLPNLLALPCFLLFWRGSHSDGARRILFPFSSPVRKKRLGADSNFPAT